MDDRFETLLKSNRNWLSKYGGLISVLIIILLIYGILQIQIPQYVPAKLSASNVITLPSNTMPNLEKGNVLHVQNIEGIETALTVVSIDLEKQKKHIQYTTAIQLNADADYKVIVAKHSLLNSIKNSFFKKN